MGETRHRIYTEKDTRSWTTLKIYGPKCLIKQSEPITAVVKVTSTWEALLNDQLKLNVPVDQGVYICNRKDNGSPKWCNELDQQVLHYVDHYTLKMGTHTVFIRHPDTDNFIKYRKCLNTVAKLRRILVKPRAKKTKKPPLPPPSKRRQATPPPSTRRQAMTPPPPAIPSTSKGITTPQQSKNIQDIPTPEGSVSSLKIDNVYSVVNVENVAGENQPQADDDRWANEEMPEGHPGVPLGNEHDDDQLSVVTTASQQVEELRRLGVKKEDVVDIRTEATRQFEIFGSNSTLLLMRHEVQTLMQNGLWANVARRAPRSAYFIERLLSGMNGLNK